MKALFELFRRFDARRIFGFIRRLGGMSRPKVKCYDLRSTHALRVEGDLFPVARKDAFHISIHALRVEGDSTFCSTPSINRYFYPRPPGGGRLSVHSKSKIQKHFYPRPPGGGRLASGSAGRSYVSNFYPRPPGGGRRRVAIYGRRCWIISIHALRVEGDRFTQHAQAERAISIHALRVEGDVNGKLEPIEAQISIHALRVEGDRDHKHDWVCCKISIHALRVEGDFTGPLDFDTRFLFLSTPSGWRATPENHGCTLLSSDFYPRPPGGGRLDLREPIAAPEIFLSTPSGWRATGAIHFHGLCNSISIHALRVEGDAIRGFKADGGGHFYPRPPGGGRLCNLVRSTAKSGFLSTPSGWRATCRNAFTRSTAVFTFLSTPSGWRATHHKKNTRKMKIFLSTPSGWRATWS